MYSTIISSWAMVSRAYRPHPWIRDRANLIIFLRNWEKRDKRLDDKMIREMSRNLTLIEFRFENIDFRKNNFQNSHIFFLEKLYF